MKKKTLFFVSFFLSGNQLQKFFFCLFHIRKVFKAFGIYQKFWRPQRFSGWGSNGKCFYNGNITNTVFAPKVSIQSSKWQINVGNPFLIDQNGFSCYWKQKQNSILEKVCEKFFLLIYYQFIKKLLKLKIKSLFSEMTQIGWMIMIFFLLQKSIVISGTFPKIKKNWRGQFFYVENTRKKNSV